MKKTLGFLTALAATFALFTACDSGYEAYIDEVAGGYLGGCLDVTVGEVLEASIPGGSWDSGETDSGKIIVEYSADIEGIEMAMQFTVTDENHFKLSAMVIDGEAPGSTEEAGALIESRYASYYGIKYPDRAAYEFLPNEPSENMTNGISAAYAEKAKNPDDISGCLNKTEEELKSELNLTDEDGLLSNPDMYIMYDDEAGVVDTATVTGRIYSLFGAASYMPIETALANVSDSFTVVTEESNYDGTSSVLLIKNGSEDSLIINYDEQWGIVSEVTYMKDGLLGYSEEAAQPSVSWEVASDGSFICYDSGANVFIGIMTDYMEPYIEGLAGDGYTEVYGKLMEVTASKLHYSSDTGEFDVIVYSSDSIEIVNASGSMAAFAGSYEKFNSVKAG